MDIIVHPDAAHMPAVLDDLDAAAASFANASKSAATRRAYASDWRHFNDWCIEQGANPAPADSRAIGRYFSHLAGLGLTVSTIDRRAAAIACAHRALGFDSPTAREEVRAILSGIRNTIGKRPNKKRALTVDLVKKVVRKIKPDRMGLRDRALILLCFGAALRRSELCSLRVEDLDWHRKGLLVRLGKTKTDQTGEGRTVAIEDGKLKIPEAVREWLDAAAIAEGPIFRGCDNKELSRAALTDGQFARILKRRCANAGLDPNVFSGHSPRRGFATSAGDHGADLRLTARHMRHAKLETTMGYMEDGELFRNSAGKKFL